MITWKNCFKVGVSALILFFCIFYFKTFANVLGSFLSALTPFFIGLIIAYLLNIIMCFYERNYFKKKRDKKAVIKTKRPVCMIAAILTLCSIIAAVIWLVIPELVSCVKFIVSEIPKAINELLKKDWVTKNLSPEVLASLTKIDWQNYLTKAFSVLQSGVTSVFDVVVTAVTSVVSGVVTAFLSIVFSIYLLAFKEPMLNGIKRLMNAYLRKKTVERSLYFFDVCNKCFHNYIVGQCTEAVILGLLCTIGMTVFRIPYAVMIGTLVGFTALIPIAGAYIGAVVGAFMILTVSPVKALIFIIFLVILQQLEGNLIYPKVVGDSIGLPAIFVLLAVTVGGSLAGVLGMILGVPLAAAMYVIVKQHLNKKEKLTKEKENEAV